MGLLADRLAQKLADIEGQIVRVKATASADLASLVKQRQILLAAGALLTDDIEKAFALLQSIGVFPNG